MAVKSISGGKCRRDNRKWNVVNLYGSLEWIESLAQPDPMSGGMATIQTIQIYSGAGQLLEQLEDVNTWTAMYMHYTKTQGLTNHQKISTTKTNYTKNYTNYLQLQMYIHIPGLIQTYRKKIIHV